MENGRGAWRAGGNQDMISMVVQGLQCNNIFPANAVTIGNNFGVEGRFQQLGPKVKSDLIINVSDK